jgi:hypothetical protein
VSNTASIKLNSNVVTEYTRSKKSLIKYPRVALGTNSTSYSGLSGGSTVNGYTIKASDEYNSDFVTSKAFTNTRLDDADTWISGSSAYNSTTKLPVTNSATTTKFGQDGSWLEIKLPNAIQLHYIHVFSRNTHITERIDTADIWASNTGTDGDWVKLTTISFNADYTDTNPMVGNIDTWTYYQYFAIQITKIGWAGTYTNVGEWELHGVPEYDPEAHGTDVIMRSVPNVPNTDWLEVYYDGQDYTSMPSTVTDKSGNGVTGTPNGGVGFDTEYKAFTFDGVDDYITSSDVGISGAQVLSMTGWLKTNSLGEVARFGIGTYTAARCMYFTVNNSVNSYYIVCNANNNTYTGSFPANTWLHVTMIYLGSNISNTTLLLYINGVLQIPSTGAPNTAALNLPSPCELRLGRGINGGYTSGSIANFRLFNRALSADEVWQLYAYQKDYFQVSPDVVTFKGGRLGIGTREPRAVLDVRGDLYAHGSVVQVLQSVKTNSASTNSTSFVDTGLEITITPKSTSSKILVSYAANIGTKASHTFLRLVRNGTPIAIGDAAGSRVQCTHYVRHLDSQSLESYCMEFLDSPSTTGAVTYKLQYSVTSTSYTITLNRAHTDGDNAYYGRGPSTITAKEIAQ